MRRNDADWFPFSSDFPMHRKTLKLCRLLGARADCFPMRMMAWLREQENVDGAFVDDGEVEQAARWDGKPGELVAALREAGFLDGLTYHGWDSKGGHAVSRMLSRRVLSARNLQTSRTQPAEVPSTSTSKSLGARGEAPARRRLPGSDCASFVECYDAYPKHEDRADAWKAWQAVKPDAELVVTILAAIGRQKGWRKWREGFIKTFARWLKGSCWADEEGPATGSPARNQGPKLEILNPEDLHPAARAALEVFPEDDNA